MATQQTLVKLTRWTGSQHPTLSNITRLMQDEGLRPYKWDNQPNQRYAVRSHGYTKVLFVVDGMLEVSFPDINQRMQLRAGDRLEVPAHVRHGSVAGQKGAVCLEAALK